jgi:hypothetical protein
LRVVIQGNPRHVTFSPSLEELYRANYNCIIDNASLVFIMLYGRWAVSMAKEVYTRIKSG